MRTSILTAVNRHAWDRQARLALPGDRPMVPGRVEWTQYPGHGPGVELFGEVSGLTVAELGCGNGDNLAPLTVKDADCVGVDVAPGQISRARTRWGHLPIRFHCADARVFLARTRPLDICFSIFGAVGLCPPEQILPLISRHLRPGGRLIFSVPHPRWLGPRRAVMRLADGSWVPVARWTSGPQGWKAAVTASGLRCLRVDPIDTPAGDGICCLLVHAQKPGRSAVSDSPSDDCKTFQTRPNRPTARQATATRGGAMTGKTGHGNPSTSSAPRPATTTPGSPITPLQEGSHDV
ncbi:class I SAM-dependent methyltransferase [Micromonospora aurantiaca (nom. illeg.)]|uniref:class I SAM-dependent methyltransferase n=1 Tax=Micromonospora aurantiaca (nom. illeg.) TaxID=47850 RepID=UPI0035B3735C